MLLTNSRNTDIQVVFNPEKPNGLLFYSGDVSHNRDFLSISLLEHYIHFRFDLGSGLAALVSSEPLELNEWHTLRVSRIGRFASLRVDDQLLVNTVSPGMFKELNVVGNVTLGGVEGNMFVSPLSGSAVGFTGCIFSMQVAMLLLL